jgi:hypothetical protein
MLLDTIIWDKKYSKKLKRIYMLIKLILTSDSIEEFKKKNCLSDEEYKTITIFEN